MNSVKEIGKCQRFIKYFLYVSDQKEGQKMKLGLSKIHGASVLLTFLGICILVFLNLRVHNTNDVILYNGTNVRFSNDQLVQGWPVPHRRQDFFRLEKFGDSSFFWWPGRVFSNVVCSGAIVLGILILSESAIRFFRGHLTKPNERDICSGPSPSDTDIGPKQ